MLKIWLSSSTADEFGVGFNCSLSSLFSMVVKKREAGESCDTGWEAPGLDGSGAFVVAWLPEKASTCDTNGSNRGIWAS
jgi:hypothetical protein